MPTCPKKALHCTPRQTHTQLLTWAISICPKCLHCTLHNAAEPQTNWPPHRASRIVALLAARNANAGDISSTLSASVFGTQMRSSPAGWKLGLQHTHPSSHPRTVRGYREREGAAAPEATST